MQNARKLVPWYLTGWAIVGALVIFWPVGLTLVFGRIKKDRSFHGAAARSMQIVGWILTVGFSLVLFIGLIGLQSESDKSVAVAGLAICLLSTVGGGVLITKGLKLGRVVDRRRRLINLVVNEGCASVDSMASQLGCGVEEVAHSIRVMIADGFLPGFELDPDTRFVSRSLSSAAVSGRASLVHFTCAGCGAQNNISSEGGWAVCEFCDLASAGGAA